MLKTTIIILSVLISFVSFSPCEARTNNKGEKKDYFFLTEEALGNSKDILITNKNDVSVRVAAVNKTKGNHLKNKVEVSIFIDCDGKGKKLKEQRVPISHNSFAHIKNKGSKELTLCGLYNADIDPVNVHLIVYERTLSGDCRKDGSGELQSEDIVIPLYGKKIKPTDTKGFCEK